MEELRKCSQEKKYPQNVRAFRLLAEELLRKHIRETDAFDDLDTMMTDVLNQSKTYKLWKDCFLRPVLLMMAFVRAERESDWLLHL